MKRAEAPSTCDRCGLRAVRHELEQNGVIVRFCDVCYWGLEPDDEAGGPESLPVGEPDEAHNPTERIIR